MKHTAAAWGLSNNLPRHVGIIMDGNGRWATGRGLPRALGHRAGVERLRGIITMTDDLGIEALSLYAFSTENWKRPPEELGTLFSLFMEYFLNELDELHAHGVCIRILGDTAAFSPQMQTALVRAQEKTRKNPGLKLNIALNYGGRDEAAHAVRTIAQRVAEGALRPQDITADTVMGALYTGGLADVDLVIRTSGEQRLSNFLPLQSAYAELVFVEDYWPDFTERRYADCLLEYQRRSRRFGAVKAGEDNV